MIAKGAKYNDFDYDRDEEVYKRLISENMDESLAGHFANMFTRDPMLLYKEDAFGTEENECDTAAFDFFNCSNWR